MKMNGFIKTLVGGAFLGTFALGAFAESNGDIYEIRPCNILGNTIDAPVRSVDNPMDSGETLYFKIRLASRESNKSGVRSNYFSVDHAGLNTIDYDELHPLKVCIYVSGRQVWAEHIATKTYEEGSLSEQYLDITDLIFSYEVKPGDFALPIKFASADGSPMDVDEKDPSYCFQNDNAWQINYHSAGDEVDKAVLKFGLPNYSVKTPDSGMLKDYTLMSSGFYVKAADFGGTMIDEAQGIWKSVPEDSTAKFPISTTGILGSDDSVTLYVWSTDESSSCIKGGFPVYLQTGINADGTPIYASRPTQVAKVNLKGGEKTAYFTVRGVCSDTTAEYVLSPWTNYTYSTSTHAQLTDYVTAKVKCVEPLEPNISVEPESETIQATSAYKDAKTTLSITAAQLEGFFNDYPSKTGFSVSIKPTFENATLAASGDVYEYVRLSENPDEWQAAKEPTKVYFYKNSVDENVRTLYVFALGADKETCGAGNAIKFEVTIDDADAAEYFKKIYSYGLYVEYVKPEIGEPTAETVIETVATRDQEIEVVIADNYKNICDYTGYTVLYKRSAKDEWTEMEGRYKPDANGSLRLLDGTTLTEKKPSIVYTTGEYESQIKVVTPKGDVESDAVRFVVKVAEAANAHVEVRLDDGTWDSTKTVSEGTNIYVKVVLSEPYTGILYAYLKPQDEKTASCVSGKVAPLTTVGKTARGLKILANQTESTTAAIFVNDGEEFDGTLLGFDIVMCSTATYDETKIVNVGYASTDFTVLSVNVRPSVDYVKMGASRATESGTTLARSVPINVVTPFVVNVKDPSTNDLYAAAEGEKMRIRWTVDENEGTFETEDIYEGDPSKFVLNYTFRFPGKATVTFELMDKDMAAVSSESDWTEPFVVYVNVANTPVISVNSFYGTTFVENNLSKATSEMKLEMPSYIVSPVTLDIEIEVNPVDDSTGDAGKLYLAGAALTNKIDASGMPVENVWMAQIDFAQSSSASFWLDGVKSDGTQLSSAKGFVITTRVVTETMSEVYQKPWSEVFGEGTFALTLDNANPTFWSNWLGNENEKTNATEIAQGQYKITYFVGDVLADLTNALDTSVGISVEWQLNGMDPVTDFVHDTSTHIHPIVFSTPGVQPLTVRVYDKDGGEIQMTWWFDVSASKTLYLTAHGPNGGSSTGSVSQRYANSAGIGQGHVYADATFISAKNFRLGWNCALANSVSVYAFGYKINADGTTSDDDGTLDGGLDIAIDPDGNNPQDGTVLTQFYNNGVKEKSKDAYFYCWIRPDNSTGATSGETAVIAPERPEGGLANGTITLPSDGGEDESYEDTYAEAIFAKEYLTTDNMGDINQDGIPDAYVTKYKFGILADDLTVSGDDNTSLLKYNDDEDYLPVISSGVLVGLSSVYSNSNVSGGQPFTAILEVRGRGYGLNDANDLAGVAGFASEKVYADPDENENSTLSKLEYLAWVKSGFDAKWSPERPTDPTTSDTDGDGMSDGVEYYFWYRAHVGYLDENGNHFFETGRRYNPVNPGEPIAITPEEIEAAFDPRHDLAGTTIVWDEQDTDNDGLLDILEIELGTNPLDYDTDGDGLPDAYELSISNTDPCKYATNGNIGDNAYNPDGDAMAISRQKLHVVPVLDASGTYSYVCSTSEVVTAVSSKSTDAYVIATSSGEKYVACVEDLEAIMTDTTLGKVLTSSIAADSAWVYREVEGKVVAGLPAYLSRGTVVASYEKATLYTETVDVKKSGTCYRAWKYDFDSSNADADDTDVSVGKIVRGRKYGDDELAEIAVCGTDSEDTVSLIHYHVYQAEGFNPACAWLTPYTDATLPASPTRAFQNYDEFMVMSFFYNNGTITLADITPSNGKTLVTIWQQYTTDTAKIDTDGDAQPDGWELYTMCPSGDVGKFGAPNPLVASNQDRDNDGLSDAQEFSSIISAGTYSTDEEIALTHPTWLNKKLPTDPNNADTDGDDIADGEESGSFIYGSATADHAYDSYHAGGGLNPCSWDTDQDKLPDPFEVEFAGSYGGSSEETTITENDDGTATTNTVAGTTSGWNDDGMDGTVDDAAKDYDHDGLNNYQEYLVGAMRCWRYDDTASDWGSHNFAAAMVNMPEVGTSEYGKFWYDILVDSCNINGKYNPHLESFHHDIGAGYFSVCTNEWDPVSLTQRYAKQKDGAAYYMFRDGVYHDLKYPPAELLAKKMNRFFRADEKVQFHLTTSAGEPFYPKKYICCSPINHDTDYDGLDDYYELFHGLNPLLGCATSEAGVPVDGEPKARDIVYLSYYDEDDPEAEPPDAVNNWWTLSLAPRLKTPFEPNSASTWDFEVFPWLNGCASADPDGDNIRNQEESIRPWLQANVVYHHSDPSPLWFTDPSDPKSLVSRYYPTAIPNYAIASGFTDGNGFVAPSESFEYDGNVYYFRDYGFLQANGAYVFYYNLNDFSKGKSIGNGYFFSFEQNEGYDSDHDYKSDFAEAQARSKPASEIQDHNSPIRRQAMYFNGADAFLQSPLSFREFQPTDETAPDTTYRFLHFTVECWARPDEESVASDAGLKTLVERATWGDDSSVADESKLRKNFLIGIMNGRWYARFDSAGTDANQYVDISNGPEAKANEWTHIAASYEDGAFKLYVNGECVETKSTSLKPACYTLYMPIDDYGATHYGDGRVSSSIDPTVDGLSYNAVCNFVGASPKTKLGLILDNAWNTRTVTINETTLEPEVQLGASPTLDDYQSFYKGYIDEVRIWDGARTATEIKNAYVGRTRYDTAMAKENRQEIYDLWAQGASRQPTSPTVLPAQLMYHYSFDHLPGAIEANNCIKVPAGFTEDESVTDSRAIWSRPVGWKNAWWDSVALRSTVYSDTAWVPWVNDSVWHMSRYDGTTLDSFYWSTDFAGAKNAVDNGYANFRLPNVCETPSVWHQVRFSGDEDYYTARARIDVISAYDASLIPAFRFAIMQSQMRNDMLPMGGAYPRRISAAEGGMWDDQGAADAWEQTVSDHDIDDLPDWWETYVSEHASDYGVAAGTDIDWNTTVTYNGFEMSAGEAYLRDLARGMVPTEDGKTGRVDEDYALSADLDGNKVPDWWEDLYDIYDEDSEGDTTRDSDGDGLSDYAEYLISHVFNFAELDPTRARTDGVTLDYFVKIGECYLGEVFTDHDLVDDEWEALYDDYVDTEDYAGEIYANNTIYDPNADFDGDGWSNYAEFRAGTSPSESASIGVDNYTKTEYPVPAIAATVTYNGGKALAGPIVFKAWSQGDTNGIMMTRSPDAVWTCGTAASEASSTEDANDTASTAGTSHDKYLGAKPTGSQTYYLGPEQVAPGSVVFYFRDEQYRAVQMKNGVEVVNANGSDPKWYATVTDKNGVLYAAKDAYTEVEVGTVDYKTGKLDIDFDSDVLNMTKYVDPSSASSSQDDTEEEDTTTEETVYTDMDKITLSRAVVHFTWTGRKVDSLAIGKSITYYLGESDASASSDDSSSSSSGSDGEASVDTTNFGHVKEGLNQFVVFIDNDGNGEYTIGEPFGYVRDVDVGWQSGKFNVQLSDTHPIFGRISIVTSDNDRLYFYGSESGITSNTIPGTLSGGTMERVRVVRTLINGYATRNTVSSNCLEVYNRVVMDKWLNLSVRSYIHEGDFLPEGIFDIDWEYFEDEVVNNKNIEGVDPQTVTYRIVFGNGSVDPVATNNICQFAFTREFDAYCYRQLPVDLQCDVDVCYHARPTFSWSMNGHNSYTAFELQILDGSTVVYDSGVQRAPTLNAADRYVWTAPAIVGNQTDLAKIISGDHGQYTWRVQMTNAKFKPSADSGWSDSANLETAVNVQQEINDMGYSTINVAVKYAGPSVVLEKAANLATCRGKVRIQAFTAPDFVGNAIAETYVTDVASIGDCSTESANVALKGLPVNGTYYLRAYIDSNGNLKKDDFESWGYAKDPVVMTAKLAKAPNAVVYIDDADTDLDWLPDAYEYAVAGWSGTWSEVKNEKRGNIANDDKPTLKSGIVKKLASVATTSIAGANLATLQNPDFAQCLLGVSGDVAAAIQEATEQKVVPETLVISGFSLDAAAGTVKLAVDAETEAAVTGNSAYRIYAVTTESGDKVATVTVEVYHRTTMADAWSLVKTVENVKIGVDEAEVTVDLGDDFNAASGFFKVEVVQ